MENTAFIPQAPESLLARIHDSIQATGYAEISETEADAFAEPACPESYRSYALIRRMFEQGYSVSYNQEDRAFTLINEPEVGK